MNTTIRFDGFTILWSTSEMSAPGDANKIGRAIQSWREVKIAHNLDVALIMPSPADDDEVCGATAAVR